MNFIPIHSLKIYHAFKGLNAKHRKIQFILDTLRLWRRRMKGGKKKTTRKRNTVSPKPQIIFLSINE